MSEEQEQIQEPEQAPQAPEEDQPTWPQGPDYDPREDPGPTREEDQ